MTQSKSSKPRMPCIYRQQRGFSLLEVLVTIVILSMGLLGVAALQIKSLQHSQAVYQRSLANLQAQDLAERLWAGVCQGMSTSVAMNGKNWRQIIVEEWVAQHTSNAAMPNWSAQVQVGKFSFNTMTPSPGWTESGADSSAFNVAIAWNDKVLAQKLEPFTYSSSLPVPSSIPGCTP
jgi:type IV pilus assembly protein PilV